MDDNELNIITKVNMNRYMNSAEFCIKMFTLQLTYKIKEKTCVFSAIMDTRRLGVNLLLRL